MNKYEDKELDVIVNNAKNKIKELIQLNPHYFGSNSGVLSRIKSILSASCKSGSLVARTPTDTVPQIMRCVDLTILDKNATDSEIIEVAQRAAKERCATVCVYPQHIYLVNQVMKERGVSDVPPIAVVGFPFVKDSSAETTTCTITETKNAIYLGAKEIDMVLPITFKDDREAYDNQFNYIKSVIDAAHEEEIPVKVILETAYLTDYQIALASIICKIAGADWVKTSTGFANTAQFATGRMPQEKGATPRSVAIMRRAVGDFSMNDLGEEKPMGVKASGGVRDREQALAVLNAGADRIGASGGIDVELKPQSKSSTNSSLKY